MTQYLALTLFGGLERSIFESWLGELNDFKKWGTSIDRSTSFKKIIVVVSMNKIFHYI